MNKIVCVIIKHDCSNDKGIVAICTTRAKADSMLNELVEHPSCSQPVKEECYVEDGYAHVENIHGWWADYRIEEVWLDDWIY